MLDQKSRSLVLDNSYIEYAIYNIWKIDIINLIKNKASLAKNFHIQPSELDKMPMWEYEIFMNSINDMVTKENEDQQKEMDKYNIEDYKNMANPKNLQKSYQTPKIPKMPKIS